MLSCYGSIEKQLRVALRRRRSKRYTTATLSPLIGSVKLVGLAIQLVMGSPLELLGQGR